MQQKNKDTFVLKGPMVKTLRQTALSKIKFYK